MTKTLRIGAALALAALAGPTLVRAEEAYPTHQVRLIVGAAPGGITDVLARLISDYFQRSTGQSMIVENIGGAGGNIAFAQLAKAAPDGYTVGLAAAGNIVINQYLYKSMPYDPRKDLVAASPIAAAPQLVMVNGASPDKSLKDLIADAKAHPGAINFGSAGVGTTPHLSGELLQKLADIKMTHVPYRGMSPAVTDLVAGRLQMIAIGAQPVLSFIQTGQLRPLAVTDAHRLPALPEVPTTAEAGLPGYEVSSWYGIFLPKGTPDAIVDKVGKTVQAMLVDAEVGKTMAKAAFVPMVMTRKEFEDQIERESKVWGELIHASGISVE